PVRNVRPPQSKVYDRLEEPELVAGVVADAFHFARIDRPAFEQLAQAVRELNLAGPVAFGGGQRREDVGCQHVPADHDEVRRRLFLWWLLHEISNLIDAVAEMYTRLDGDHAVAGNVGARDSLHGEEGTIELLKHVDELLDRRRVGVDHIVGENDGERLVAHQLAGNQHGMPQTERLALPHVGEVDHVRDLADLRELLALAARLEVRLELNGDVEMILDSVLAAAGDENDVVGTGCHRLFDAVLDDRLVNQRKHLFGLRFCRRQESRPKSGGGEDGFANGRGHDGIVTEKAAIAGEAPGAACPPR